jgi:hypothetical protein
MIRGLLFFLRIARAPQPGMGKDGAKPRDEGPSAGQSNLAYQGPTAPTTPTSVPHEPRSTASKDARSGELFALLKHAHHAVYVTLSVAAVVLTIVASPLAWLAWTAALYVAAIALLVRSRGITSSPAVPLALALAAASVGGILVDHGVANLTTETHKRAPSSAAKQTEQLSKDIRILVVAIATTRSKQPTSPEPKTAPTVLRAECGMNFEHHHATDTLTVETSPPAKHMAQLARHKPAASTGKPAASTGKPAASTGKPAASTGKPEPDTEAGANSSSSPSVSETTGGTVAPAATEAIDPETATTATETTPNQPASPDGT